jgi:hypothetical protein
MDGNHSQGVIAIVFYSKVDNVTQFARVDAVCSADGGVHWTKDFTISGAQIIDTNAPGFGGPPRFGEYMGLSANGVTFNAAWTADNPVLGDQDIFTTSFTCQFPPPPPPLPVPFDVELTADQVIPITSNSSLAAAAFQSSTDTPAPEVITADLPRRVLSQSFDLADQPVTDVAIAPNNQKGAVMDAGGFNIIDLTATTIMRIPFETGSAASEIAITPDSRKALIALSTPLLAAVPEPSSQEMSIFDLGTGSQMSVLLPGVPLSGITVTPDSSKA